jgi:hypothetical protein
MYLEREMMSFDVKIVAGYCSCTCKLTACFVTVMPHCFVNVDIGTLDYSSSRNHKTPEEHVQPHAIEYGLKSSVFPWWPHSTSSRPSQTVNTTSMRSKTTEFSTHVMSGCVSQQPLVIIKPKEYVANCKIHDSNGMGQNV